MNTMKLKNQSFLSLQALLLVTSLFVTSFILSNNTSAHKPFFTNPLKTNDSFRGIDFVEDANGNKFVLKYPRSPEHAIQDALGAKVGNSVGININQVKILPPHDESINSVDRFPEKTKTLHTLVPGDRIAWYENLDIQNGLTKSSTLQSLTTHKDLCKIVALDIYLDNFDRHSSNYSHDKTNNRFYAFDMDMIFRASYYEAHKIETTPEGKTTIYPNDLLATKTYNFVKNLKTSQLSPEEENALRRINKTLKQLTYQYPAEKLYNDRTELAAQAHYTYNNSEQQRFHDLVQYNFEETKRLEKLLDRITYKQPNVHDILKHMAKPSNIAQQNLWQTMNS